MKLRIVLAATVALVLGACGKSGNTKPAATSSESAGPTATEASAAATPAAPAAGMVPSKDYVVGKWAEGGDCGMAMQFNADGSMVGPFDKWELDRGVLTMVGNPQKMHLTVIDPDTMESRLDGTGAPRKLTRCK
jgi:hypothetical protein